ncbi:LacI family DNA-binding transcriptional regulator [Micromonospora sp. WMMD1128]|uniref:LacI family DNA-binding transcriptional regulator n=1 Tax=unclassified Micromonospora TaxID=2617518 RepID=UPI00248CABEB|nr:MULTISPECIES: LacI family DNA-binding transcriptional regulator [unclassified Micromonospora]WBB76248.1 LacI family DNA-binding transcriptional regulator [Micromonospora sp. WMMD1128]WFE35966.1 LacI family DNA-binding transcriptional regulator [Micromonospora sp. WMMD975]
MGTPTARPATLDDVARAAGVSRATASRVLGGYGFASAGARARVSAAADHLGYVPDPTARALVRGAGVRLVVAVVGRDDSVFDDPYVHRVVSAASRVCAPHGVGVALEWLPLDDPSGLVRLGADRGVHGVILVNTTQAALDAVPARLHGRVASIGRGSATVPSFDVDNAAGAGAVLRHLYATGRRHIVMVTGPRWLTCAERSVTAYRELMRAAGTPVRLVTGDFTAARGGAAALEALRRWPDVDGVYAASDATAFGVIAALRGQGLGVPHDVAVAGFDDLPYAAVSSPALTTATHPVDRIAAAAASAVLAQAPVPPETAFGSTLVTRESA